MSSEIVAPDDVTPVLSLLPPYPVVLVSMRESVLTVNQIAYFTFRPLRIGVGIARSRHSHGLISSEREFVVNIPGASLLNAVAVCGSVSGRDGDKMARAG